jgi:hypothetical protein
MKLTLKAICFYISISTMTIILGIPNILFTQGSNIKNEDRNFTESIPQTNTYFSIRPRFYNGSLIGGMKRVKGIFEDKNSSTIYDGDFLNGKLDGFGNYTADFDYDNQEIHLNEPFQHIDKRVWKYVGYFKQGRFHGKGSLWFHTGRHSFSGAKYDGYFFNGVFEGSGTLYYKGNQLKYEGQFKKGTKTGYGIFTDHLTETKYEGYFLKDKFHGLGSLTNNNPGKEHLEPNNPFGLIYK